METPLANLFSVFRHISASNLPKKSKTRLPVTESLGRSLSLVLPVSFVQFRVFVQQTILSAFESTLGLNTAKMKQLQRLEIPFLFKQFARLLFKQNNFSGHFLKIQIPRALRYEKDNCAPRTLSSEDPYARIDQTLKSVKATGRGLHR